MGLDPFVYVTHNLRRLAATLGSIKAGNAELSMTRVDGDFPSCGRHYIEADATHLSLCVFFFNEAPHKLAAGPPETPAAGPPFPAHHWHLFQQPWGAAHEAAGHDYAASLAAHAAALAAHAAAAYDLETL